MNIMLILALVVVVIALVGFWYKKKNPPNWGESPSNPKGPPDYTKYPGSGYPPN